MNDYTRVRTVNGLFSHVWMVRTFLKHCEEAEEDEELCEVHRMLYDCMHAVGASLASGDTAGYLKQAKKKLKKLRQATELFSEIQPEISSHTNFQMAELSLRVAVKQIEEILGESLSS